MALYLLQTNLGWGGMASILSVAIAVVLLLFQIRFSFKSLNNNVKEIKNRLSTLSQTVARIEGSANNSNNYVRTSGGRSLPLNKHDRVGNMSIRLSYFLGEGSDREIDAIIELTRNEKVQHDILISSSDIGFALKDQIPEDEIWKISQEYDVGIGSVNVRRAKIGISVERFKSRDEIVDFTDEVIGLIRQRFNELEEENELSEDSRG